MSDFTWRVGAGVTKKQSDNLVFDLGYRYANFGTNEIDLKAVAGGIDSGTYELETASHQIVLGIRFKSLSRLLRRNR